MSIVSDTSPLNYLVLIDAVDLIPQLYLRLLIPPVVLEELMAEGSPPPVRRWASRLPPWIAVEAATRSIDHPRLHRGEAEAIALAEEVHAELLLVDEKIGREIARARGLDTLGVLGLLDVAASRGMVRLPEFLDRLLQTNFRISRDLMAEVILRESQRRQQK